MIVNNKDSNILVVGVGDFKASNVLGKVIKTYALGSCVAVIIYDPQTKTAGMAHIALADSNINPGRAREKPGYFADTAIPALIRLMNSMGCKMNDRGIRVKLAGGATIMDPNNTFNIGKRNILAIKRILWSYGMGAISEDIGDSISRTVSVSVNTGEVLISSPGKKSWVI